MPADMELSLGAAVLHQGKSIDQLCGGLSLLAVGLGLYAALVPGAPSGFAIGMALLALLGLAQKALALRVALDAELFQAMAVAPQALPERTAQLDRALASLLRVPADKAARPWPERARGALRLLRWQALLAAAQWLFALVCLLTLAP
ncbi:hypothetical protein [Pseudomonas citronellolis]|uniref:hypothetical protein n=1 Tax=Pseudomonas citronellolis TaxID=53408 RepID=UPI0023E39459|nr:hypothetical protein [Pseudomonas citronellolis]MDF3933207.1 hypothetical protein [Pseudomonas citronellolis]